ncbi:hypothetical protein DASC09_031510 [Saccharomycopsis crataegensis]|uniref:Centrosomin N-terminal motif 1 domain-containing protein n=1 Tax=Saccharomycopsis crataegensis TaxID=43959 RepID=A0AAV5QMH1_9ASCO|nr:hypothetical protein DASC09_031510 [Saccharomycopsis crataegensis]
MASYKHLIGTPLDRTRNNNRNNNAYQFTPIGHEDSDLEFSVLNDTNRKKQSASLLNTVSKLRQNRGEDINVDDSFDSFSASTPLVSSVNNSVRDQHVVNKENISPSSGRTRNSHYDELLRNSSNPLKQQQELIDGLKSENYGLKIKISSLTKYLNVDMNTPENIKNMINENSDLKSQITQLTMQLENLRNAESEPNTSATSNNSLLIQMNTMKNEKQELISKVETLEKECEFLNQKLEEVPSFVANEKDDDADNITELRNNLEDFQYELRAKTHEIEEKDLEITQLQNKCQRLEEMKDADLQENDRLEETLIDKNEELKALNKEIQNINYENHQLKLKVSDGDSKIHSLDNKVLKLESDKSNLKVKLKSMEGNGTTVSKKVDKLLNELNTKSEKILQLNETIRELQSQNTLNESELTKMKSYNHSLENQINSGDSHYELENEILRLRSMENNLRNEISHYKLEISELQSNLQENQNTLMDNSTFLHNVEQVEIERDQAYDDLKIYEDHILELENKLDQAISQIDSSQDRLREMDHMIISLKQENDSLKKQLSVKGYSNPRSVTFNSKTKNKNGGFFSSFWNGATDVDTDEDEQVNGLSATSTIRKLTKEKEEFKDEINALQLKVKHLNEDLSNERLAKSQTNVGSYEKDEIKKLAKQKNDLEILMENRKISFESQINDYKQNISKLVEEVKSKDLEIEGLSSTLKKDSFKVDSLGVEREEHMQLLKKNMENEKKNMMLNFEIEKLRSDYEIKSEMLNKEIESLKKSLTDSIQPSGAQKNLEEKKREIESLKSKIETFETENEELRQELARKVKELNSKYEKLTKNYQKVYSRYKSATKSKNQLSDISLELEDESSKSSETGLKGKLLSKERELEALEADYNLMKTKMSSKVRELSGTNISMNGRIDDLSKELQQLKVGISGSDLKKLRKLENAAHYYREKFHQELYLTQDLKFVNQYLNEAIRKSNKMILSDVNKLVKTGKIGLEMESIVSIAALHSNEPELKNYKSLNNFLYKQSMHNTKPNSLTGKLTFKGLAKFVLATVRLQKRVEKSIKKGKLLKAVKMEC